MKSRFLLFALLFSFAASAQICTPDPANLPAGYYPNMITDGTETLPYNHTVTVVVPVDTTISGFAVPIDSLVVTNITGLPSGLSFACNLGSCGIPGGDKGCVELSGRPDQGTNGLYPVTVEGVVYANLFGSPVSAPFSQFYDTLQILGAPMTLSADFIWNSDCEGDSIQFLNYTQGASSSWSWNFGTGDNSNIENPRYLYPSANSYSVKLVVGNGAITDSITKLVTIYSKPTVSGPMDDTACQGSMLNLSASGTGGNTYRWRPAADFTAVDAPVTVYMVPQDTTQMYAQNQIIIRHIDTPSGCYSEDTAIIYGERCQTSIEGLFDGEEVYAYPNPVQDRLNVEFYSERNRKVEMSLMDLTGRIIFSDRKEIETGQNMLELDLGAMASGWYVLRMRDGRESWQQGLVVD